jgi:hypothetical protein
MTDQKPWADMTPEERAAWFAAMREQRDAVHAKLLREHPESFVKRRGLRDRRYNG